MTGISIRPFAAVDGQALVSILRPVFQAGDTYAIDPGITDEAAIKYWCAPDHIVHVAERDETILGTYYLRRNQGGGGAHVCNCGYVTATAARGQGVARAMLAHSLDQARAQQYRAMQFNFVLSSNAPAIRLWQRAGFEIVGRIPQAFQHPADGYVDAYIMWKDLTATYP